MSSLRRISHIAVCVLVLSGAVTGVSSGDNVTAENATVGDLSESPQHGYNASEIQAGLSLDPDTNYQSNADFGNNTFGARVDATDAVYTRPRATYRDWNKQEHMGFSPGGESASRYPESATLYDGRWIRDAHATRFRHSPSTIAYYDNKAIKYTGSEGTVRGVVDYRVKQPISDGRPGNPHRFETFRDRSLKDHSIKSVCVIRKLERSQIVDRENVCQDGPWVIGTDSPSPHPAIDYANQNQRSPTNYTLVAVIEASVNVKVEQYRDNDNDDEYDPEWDVVDEYVATDTVIATDQWVATPYDFQETAFSQTNYSGTQYEDGRSGVYFEAPEHPWAGLKVDDTYVSSEWRFYSHRNTDWDTVTKTTNTGDKTTATYETVPIQNYAVPSPYGVKIQQPSQGSDITVADVKQNEEQTIPTKASHENLSIRFAGNQSKPLPRNYSRVTALTVQGDNIGYDNVTAKGAVNGSEKDAGTAALRFDVDRKESNLTARVDEANSTHVAVNIWLHDEDGNPIALGERHRGVIRLPTNRTIQTNRTGQARVVIENHTTGRIQYEPEIWHGKTVAYKPSAAYYKAYPALRSQAAIMNWVGEIILLLLPLVLPWYYIRQYEQMAEWIP
jgi:hypothetical protein